MDKGIVYILQSGNSGRYYIGSTSDLERRIRQHRRGQTHTTKRFGRMKLVFFQRFQTLLQARKVESKLKSWKRKDFIEKIINDGVIKVVVK